MPVIDNMDDYLDDIGGQMPSRSVHVLTLANVMEYAEHLQNKAGYFVFNMSHLQQTLGQWLQRLVASQQMMTDENVEHVLDATGFEEVNFLRSYTSTMRPPVKPGEGDRRAHPGGWSDVTGNLAGAYTHQVNDGHVRTDKDYA